MPQDVTVKKYMAFEYHTVWKVTKWAMQDGERVPLKTVEIGYITKKELEAGLQRENKTIRDFNFVVSSISTKLTSPKDGKDTFTIPIMTFDEVVSATN